MAPVRQRPGSEWRAPESVAGGKLGKGVIGTGRRHLRARLSKQYERLAGAHTQQAGAGGQRGSANTPLLWQPRRARPPAGHRWLEQLASRRCCLPGIACGARASHASCWVAAGWQQLWLDGWQALWLGGWGRVAGLSSSCQPLSCRGFTALHSGC